MTAQATRARARARILAVLDQLAEHGLPGDREELADQLVVAALGPAKITARLPSRSTCAGCGRIKVPNREYIADKSLREQGFVMHGTGDLCSGCDQRRRRGASGPADPARNPHRRESTSPARFPISPAIVAELRAADPDYAAASQP